MPPHRLDDVELVVRADVARRRRRGALRGGARRPDGDQDRQASPFTRPSRGAEGSAHIHARSRVVAQASPSSGQVEGSARVPVWSETPWLSLLAFTTIR